MPSPLEPTRRDFLVTAGAALAAACTTPAASPTTAVADAHDEALASLVQHGPEFGGGLSNHGPMAIEALGAMQRADAIPKWLANYRPNLQPAPALGKVLPPADHQEQLGKPAAFPDWEATFAALLQEQPWQTVVGAWQTRLLPGMLGALAHGVIRTGHAVRAMTTKDTPLRRQELARALAYQAANFRPLLGPPGDGLGEPLAALAKVPLLPANLRQQQRGASDRRIAEVREHAPFAAALAQAGPRDNQPFLTQLLATLAQQFVRHGADSPIMFCHAFTATAALVPLWPCLDEATRALGCRHAWQLAAAIQCRFAKAVFTPPELEAVAWPEDLIDAAVSDGDEHVIKLTAACALAWRQAPSPAFVAAARAITRLL